MNEALAPDDDRLATLALARLTLAEIERLQIQLFGEDEPVPTAAAGSLAMRALTLLATRLARARREAPVPAMQARASVALARLRERVAGRHRALAAAAAAQADPVQAGPPPGDLAFLVQAYRTELRRGIHPRELDHWEARMREAPLERAGVIGDLQRVAADEAHAARKPGDPARCWIMGTGRTIGPDDWQRRAQALADGAVVPAPEAPTGRIHLRGEPRCLVTAIASLYRGGEFIEAFMDNITGQSIFRDWCELIVVDAASPDGEADTIRRYMADFPNIRYIRTPERIGIYPAWNFAVREARGEFLTNTNLDDPRRRDAFEVQAATLQALPEVDVVYQDFYYTLQPHLSFEQAAAFGFRSRVPPVTPRVMLEFNPPHNAPMWRRRLHDEVGGFDERYRSAGDYEFWLRCVAAGKVFHKIDEALVAYYQNPEGISTRADTPGHVETREITARYAGQLLGTAERAEPVRPALTPAPNRLQHDPAAA